MLMLVVSTINHKAEVNLFIQDFFYRKGLDSKLELSYHRPGAEASVGAAPLRLPILPPALHQDGAHAFTFPPPPHYTPPLPA